MTHHFRPVEVLLIEDNLGDARLIDETLKENKVKVNLHHVQDGIDAIAFLNRDNNFENTPDPDLILLDLNLPRMDGREVLEIIKTDEQFKRIPVVVLTTSSAEEDIIQSYNLHANAYVTKPVDLDQFIKIVLELEEFWFTIVKLPPNGN